MDNLYSNGLLYDMTYDADMDSRVKKYWEHVLDGCDINTIHDCSIGTGQLTLALAMMGYELSGSDLSEEMLESCKNNALSRGLNIPLKKCDFRCLTEAYDSAFDCVLSTGNSLPHVTNEDVKTALAEMDRLVAPSGYLYLDTRNWDKILRDHQRFFFYHPWFLEQERINLTQVWDYNNDGTMTFNLLYTFEKDQKPYKKEISSVTYYPISGALLERFLTDMGYRILKKEPHFQNAAIEDCDWYYILAKKEARND